MVLRVWVAQIKGFFFYFSIPIAAIPGAIVDTCASVAKSSSAGVITTLVVASVGAALMSGLQSASVGHLIIAETSGKVAQQIVILSVKGELG